MTIKNIEINNVKSIKNANFELKEVNSLIGENGSGKTNVLKAIKYFYDNLTEESYNNELFDKSNPYSSSFEIIVHYDFSELIRVKNHQIQRNGELTLNRNFLLISQIEKLLDTDKVLKVKMTQSKHDLPKWNGLPYEYRFFLKNQFPIYFVQTRHIDLYDWSYVWEAIGELSKIKADEKNLDKELEKFFNNFYTKHSRFKEIIEQTLKDSDIEVKKFKPHELFSHIHQLQLGGQQFKFQENNLEYFSDGLNSFGYLSLLISLINQLSNNTLKAPTVILDEPEIGLHPQKIDQLANGLIEKSTNEQKSYKLNYIIATHSPRLIRNIINSDSRNNVYRIKMHHNHSAFNKLNKFIEKNEKLLLTEKEASYFFSKGILFVEGITELELFQHSFLKKLFPLLDKVDVFSFDSNNIKLNTVHPSRKNTKIPYILLLDLDKLIFFNESNKVSLKTEINNPLTDEIIMRNENFLFGQKRINTFELRKKIKDFRKETSAIIPNPKFQFIDDFDYQTLKKLIRQYCLEYNVYPVDTTIEGAIINANSLELILDWLLLCNQIHYEYLVPLVKLLNLPSNFKYKTTVFRLLFNGKQDNLKKLDHTEYNQTLQDQSNFQSFDDKILFEELYDLIKKNNFDKASGWVSSFFDYLSRQGRIKNRNDFKNYFPELTQIVEELGKKSI